MNTIIHTATIQYGGIPRALCLWLFAAVFSLCMIHNLYASGNNILPTEKDQSGSPRFLVQQGESNAFALRSTEVVANIVGVIADVRVRQVYMNRGKSPVEATYIFPASTRAAVYGMTMTVGKRIIKAVVKEKEQARQEYTAAVQQGKTASLLEQLKPNIFQMNVANILGGDSVVVELRYTEAIVANDGVYEFVYPGVVGPRYVSGVPTSEYDAVMSGRDLPKEVPGTFTINTTLSTGVPVKDVQSPSHAIDVQRLDAAGNKTTNTATLNSVTTVALTANNGTTNNRDYILRYRLTGRSIESGLLLSKGKDENYFMLMVQPPRQVEIPNILPREFVFIVDVSGSMWGFPLDVTRQLMDKLFSTLRPTDKFNILLFSGGSKTLADNSLNATPENIQKARSFMQSGYGGGGTELLPALKKAFSMQADSDCSRSFVVITDGYVTIEREAFELVRNSLNKANIYAFGIGPSVNRYLIEGLAHAGKAEPMIVSTAAEAPAMADRFRQYIEAPVLTDISVDWGAMQVYDVDPLSIPDATSKRPIVVFGKWKGEATGNLRLKGTAAEGAYSFSVNIAAQPLRPEHEALRYLWARNRITFIEEGATINSWGGGGEPSEAEKKVITDIGLKYNLLTKYTSFIAVDSVVSVKKDNDVARATLKDTIIFLDRNGKVLKTIDLDNSYRNLPISSIAKEHGFKKDVQWKEIPTADTTHFQNRPFPSVMKFVTIEDDQAILDTGAEHTTEKLSTDKTLQTNPRTYMVNSSDSARPYTYTWTVTGGSVSAGDISVKLNANSIPQSPVKRGKAEPSLSAKEGAKGRARKNTVTETREGTVSDMDDIATHNETGNVALPAGKASAQPRDEETARKVIATTPGIRADDGISIRGGRAVESFKTAESSSVASSSSAEPLDKKSTTDVFMAFNPTLIVKDSMTTQSAPPTTVPTNTTTTPTVSRGATTPQAAPATVSPEKDKRAASVSRTFEESDSSPLTPGAHNRWHFGFNVGANHARFNDYDYLSRMGEKLRPSPDFALGWAGGLSMEVAMGTLKENRSSFFAELTYERNRMNYSFPGHTPAYKNDQNFEPTTALADYRTETDLRKVGLRLLYRFNLGKTPVGLRVGPSVGYIISSQMQEYATLPDTFLWVRPGGDTCNCMRVEGNKAILALGAVPNLNRFQVGIAGGIQYELLLHGWTIVPNLTFEYPFTTILSGSSRRTLTYSFGINLMFPL